jgi:hypothetical protein
MVDADGLISDILGSGADTQWGGGGSGRAADKPHPSSASAPSHAPVWLGVLRSTTHHSLPPQQGVLQAEKYEGWIVRPWGDRGCMVTIVGQTDTKTGLGTMAEFRSGIFQAIPRFMENVAAVARGMCVARAEGARLSSAAGGGGGSGESMSVLAAAAAALEGEM